MPVTKGFYFLIFMFKFEINIVSFKEVTEKLKKVTDYQEISKKN